MLSLSPLLVVYVVIKSRVTVQPALPGPQEILKKWRIFLQRTCDRIPAKVIVYLGTIKVRTFDAFGHKVQSEVIIASPLRDSLALLKSVLMG